MFCIITTPQLYPKTNFLLTSPRGGKIKQQTMLKTEDGEEPSGVAMLRETIAAYKSFFEELGLQPVININVVNHYHGDIENYNNY